MNHPNEPTNPDSPWEEAMSRDFDARVRDLHEAPLDVTTVKGKARKIRRNRRAAVAGSILGVAAIVTPIAVLSNGGSTETKEPDFADPTESETIVDPSALVPDYIADGIWHQADGDRLDLPEKDYFGAVIWNDQLVATRVRGEVFAAADVIAADGTVVDTFDTTSTVVVNEAGTTIAWVDTEGEVMTAWEGDQVSMGSVDLAAPGETVAYFTAAVTGGPNCYEVEDGCVVFVNSGVGEAQTFDSHGINDNPVPFVIEFSDVSGDHLVSYVDKIENAGSCGGLIDLKQTNNRPEWKTCEYEPAQISPDSKHVIGLPSYYDGLGIPTISVLDAETGEPTGGQYSVEGGFISQWAWSTDGHVVFDAYDGAKWHLFAMTPDGAITEIGESATGEEFDSPFTLIQH